MAIDWKGRSLEWTRLVGELFHGEESPMFRERPGGLVCIDCGVACTEDISDIEHEDGCVVGPLYSMLMTGRAEYRDDVGRAAREFTLGY